MGKKTLVDAARELEANEVRELKAKIEKLQRAKDSSDQQARHLQHIIEHQSALIEKKAKTLFRSHKTRQGSSKHFHRVLVPDSHGCHIDTPAANAFLRDLEHLAPQEVVWLGDHLDCGGFLAEHHVLGFVPECEVEFVDDVLAANQFLDEVQSRTKKSVHHFLTGNHEHRIEKWCIKAAGGKARTARMFLDSFGVQHVLHLEQRGFHYYSRSEVEKTHNRVRGAIKLGECYFVHDVSTASDPTAVAINRWGSNVVFGDTHRIVSRVGRKAERDIIAATVGYLAKAQPYWQETNVTDWSHGYGLQIVADSGEFLHITVPIIEGKSLLGPLLGVVK